MPESFSVQVSFVLSFKFNKRFILVKAAVDPEPSPGTMNTRW